MSTLSKQLINCKTGLFSWPHQKSIKNFISRTYIFAIFCQLLSTLFLGYEILTKKILFWKICQHFVTSSSSSSCERGCILLCCSNACLKQHIQRLTLSCEDFDYLESYVWQIGCFYFCCSYLIILMTVGISLYICVYIIVFFTSF